MTRSWTEVSVPCPNADGFPTCGPAADCPHLEHGAGSPRPVAPSPCSGCGQIDPEDCMCPQDFEPDWEAEAKKWGEYAAKLTEELQAMTKARDHCKKQTDDLAAMRQAEMSWLRENHPDIYEEAINAHAWG